MSRPDTNHYTNYGLHCHVAKMEHKQTMCI